MQARVAVTLSLFAFAFATCLGLAACGDDGIECTVTWWSGAPDTSDLLGETVYNYGTSNADKAVDRCAAEQETDPDRPAGANGHSCDCETK